MTSPTVEHAAPSNSPARSSDFATLNPFPAPWRLPLHSIVWLIRLLWGIASLIVLLTLLASVPVGNIFVLGYLIYAQEQVACSGKLRRALPGLPAYGRLAELAIGIALCLTPVWLLASATKDMWLIAPDHPAAWVLFALLVVTSFVALAHLLLAVARGGSIGCFLRPIKNVRWLRQQLREGDYWTQAENSLRLFIAAIRPVHCLRLGLIAFMGTCVWLLVPIVIYSTCRGGGRAWQQWLVIVGGIWLIGALAWLPFLQARMAVENRFAAIFEWRPIRELCRHSPLTWLLATAAFYAASIPLFLYSDRIRLRAPIHDVWWDLALVSLVCTFPARIFVGWAYHRATVRRPAWNAWVWVCRIILVGLLAVYVWLLFQTPMTHEVTPWQLEYHALLLPMPW